MSGIGYGTNIREYCHLDEVVFFYYYENINYVISAVPEKIFGSVTFKDNMHNILL